MGYAYCSYPSIVNNAPYDSGTSHEAFQYLRKVLSLPYQP